MILVLLGTQKYKFERLVNYILQYVKEEALTEKFIIQIGKNDYSQLDIFATYDFSNIKFVEYVDDYNLTLQKCDFVICHGGVGIIMESLLSNKKVITVPRKLENGEHLDNHQEEITLKLSQDNYLFLANDYSEFKQCMINISNHQFNTYISNTQNFNEKLSELLETII